MPTFSYARDGMVEIVRLMAALNVELLRRAAEVGPLMKGYCDECGGNDCVDWQCQAIRMAVPYDLESTTYETLA